MNLRSRLSLAGLTALIGGSGVLHFVVPRSYQCIVPAPLAVLPRSSAPFCCSRRAPADWERGQRWLCWSRSYRPTSRWRSTEATRTHRSPRTAGGGPGGGCPCRCRGCGGRSAPGARRRPDGSGWRCVEDAVEGLVWGDAGLELGNGTPGETGHADVGHLPHGDDAQPVRVAVAVVPGDDRADTHVQERGEHTGVVAHEVGAAADAGVDGGRRPGQHGVA